MTRERRTGYTSQTDDSISMEVFQTNLPDAAIEFVPLESLPSQVREKFERKSALFIHPNDYKPGNFKRYFAIHHNAGDITYAAQQIKTYSTNGDTEDLVYLIDVDHEGKEEGHGEIRSNVSNESPYFKAKPFVGYTATEEDYRGKGLGTRRLFMMNALCQTLYGAPLNSDTNITDEAKGIWEKLVIQGKARKYKEGKNDRFVFV